MKRQLIILFVIAITFCVSCRSLKVETKSDSSQDCDLKRSIDFINQLQSEAFLENKKAFSRERVAKILKGPKLLPYLNINTEEDSIITEWSKQPTIFKNSGAYTPLFNIYKDQITDVANKRNIRIDTNSFFVLSHYTDSPNASTYKMLDCDKKFIFMNDRFADFCYEVPRELAASFNFRLDGPDNDLSIEANYNTDSLAQSLLSEESLSRYESRIRKYWGIETWSDTTISQEKLIFVSFVTQGMEVFTIAHEIAHIFLNHDSKTNYIYFFSNEKDSLITVENKYYNWAQEFEADYRAAILLSDIIKQERADKQYIRSSDALRWAPIILMTNRELYNYLKLLKNGVNREWKNYDKNILDEFKAKLLSLHNQPVLKDFQSISKAIFKDSVISDDHPPEAIRKEVIKFALYKEGIFDINEYNSTKNFANLWHVGIKFLYNTTRDQAIDLRNKYIKNDK